MPAPVWLFRKVAVGELEGVDVIGVVDARKEDAGEVVDWNELLVLVDDCDCDTSNDERVLEGVLEGILLDVSGLVAAGAAFFDFEVDMAPPTPPPIAANIMTITIPKTTKKTLRLSPHMFPLPSIATTPGDFLEASVNSNGSESPFESNSFGALS